jgi:hypothetical protein
MSTPRRIAAAFEGTLVHCPSLGQLEILEDHLLREDLIFRPNQTYLSNART